MGESARNLRRNLVFNTAGNLIYFLCQWLVTGLLVKTLSPQGESVLNAGLLATAMAVSNMFLTLASFGMRSFQVSDPGRYPDRVYIRSRWLTMGAALVLCAAYSLAAGYRSRQLLLILLWLCYKLLEALTDVYHGCCQKRGVMDRIGISYGVRGVIAVAAFSLTLRLTGNLLAALLAVTVLSYAFSVWYDLVLCGRRYVAPGGEGESALPLLRECLPLAVYAFLNTACASVPKLVLERLCGPKVMGVFSLVNSPVLILQVGIAYLFSPFLGVFSELFNSGDRRGFLRLSLRISLAVAALGLLGLGGVLLLGRFGLELLYGGEIAAYAYLLPYMVVATVFTCLSILYCMLLTVIRDIKGLIASNAAGIAASFLFSFALIPSAGMVGASLAGAAALAVQCTCLALSGCRKLGFLRR